MKNSTKGLGLLVLALGALVALASWFLNDDGPPGLARAGQSADRAAAEQRAAEPDAAATPTAATAAGTAAMRAEQAPAPSGVDGAARSAVSALPTAEFLSGIVVDQNGRPVAGADVTFGAPAGISFGRPGRGGGRRIALPRALTGAPEDGPAIARARTAEDGGFRLAEVARGEGFSLKVDHPDFVIYRRDDLVIPASGMEVGRVELEPGATVSGQVFGPGSVKLAGAEVALEEVQDADDPASFFNFMSGPFGERSAVTDAEGRFRISGLPANKAKVIARAEGLAEAESAALDLKPMQEAAGVTLHLERGHAIAGIVRDASGSPIADAEVFAISANSGLPNFRRFGRLGAALGEKPGATSDVEGRFRLRGLKGGVYELNVQAQGFASKSVAGIEAGAPQPVEVSLARSSRIGGVVRLKDSPELPKDVQVQVVPYYGDRMPMTSLDMPDRENVTRSLNDGSFLIEDVEPGTWRVIARAAGTTRGTSDPITLADGQSVEDLALTVERGAILTGRVLDAATGAPVADAEVSASLPPPPPDAPAATGGPGSGSFRTTIVTGVGGRRGVVFGNARQTVARGTTDGDGRFQLTNLAAGAFDIEVAHADFATSRTPAVEVATGESKEGVDVRLGRGGTLEGTVLGIDGQPRAGDRVDVDSKAVDGVSLSGVTDANGYYRVEHIPAGEAVATRNEREEASNARPFMFRAMIEGAEEPERGKRVTVAEGETVRVDFSQVEKPYIEGVVTCADGPVVGASVSVSADFSAGMPMLFGDQKRAQTGPDGRFRLADLDPGSYRISVRHPQGLVPVRASVKLEAGAPARQDFFLEGGVVEGVVAAAQDKAALESATVTLRRVSGEGGDVGAMVGEFAIALTAGRSSRGGARSLRFGGDGIDTRVLTDKDGRYRIPWVPAGKYKVSASREGFLEGESAEIEVKANESVDGVRVELPPAARLSVKVRSKANQQALSNCVVELRSEGEGGGHEFGMTDAEGIAHFDSLRPGTWTVTGKKGFDSQEQGQDTVTCDAGRTAEVTLDL